MNSRTPMFLGSTILWLGLTSTIGVAQRAPVRTPPPTPAGHAEPAPKKAVAKIAPVSSHAAPSPDHNAVLRRYCITCHNDTRKTGGLSLATFDVALAASQPILLQVAQEASMKDMANRFQAMSERLMSDPDIRRSAEEMQQKLMSDPETRQLIEELMRRLGTPPEE